MAADMKIHVMDAPGKEVSRETLRVFFNGTLGSKLGGWPKITDDMTEEEAGSLIEAFFAESPTHEEWGEAYLRVAETPGVWVGEVSWLKAALTGDVETYIPDPVSDVREAIGEDLPIIDQDLIERVMQALKGSNETGYDVANETYGVRQIREFLETHRGLRAFTVSW